MWTIRHTATFANRTGAEAALGRIQSDLSEMAHTKIEVYSDQLLYPIGRARWWMGGKPLDMTDGGSFVVDHASCDLAASVSLKRTFLSCLAMSLAVSALAVLVYDDANWPELGFMVCWPSVGCGVATTIGHNKRLPNTWGQSHKPPKGRFPPIPVITRHPLVSRKVPSLRPLRDAL